jgi:hypothetical protein
VSTSTRSAVLQQFQQQNEQQPVIDQQVSAQIRPIARLRSITPLERQDQLLAGLLLGSPEFQRR